MRIVALSLFLAEAVYGAAMLPPHPRLFLTDAALHEAMAAARTDPLRAALHQRIIRDAEAEIADKPVRYRLNGEHDLLDESGRVLRHVLTEGMAWRLTGDRRFAERAKADLVTAAAFPDWNPRHFLDTAEMSLAFAVGYDWLWPWLSSEERATIARAMREKALDLAPGAYGPNSRTDKRFSWATQAFNWNQVCNGGLLSAALAIGDEDPGTMRLVVEGVRRSLAPSMAEYRPDGAYPEGPKYWWYGTSYNVIALDEMDGVLGGDFGLGSSEAFDRTALYRMAIQGPTGAPFSYADSWDHLEPAAALTWLGLRYHQPGTIAFCRRMLTQAIAEGRTHDRLFALHAAWFPTAEAAAGSGAPTPLDLHFRGVADLAMFRSAWNDPQAIFVGFKAGANSFHHAHLDLGSFVLDAEGQRWSADLGLDSYSLPSYFDFEGGRRWQYLRTNNFGHSTVTLDAVLQRRAATAPITAFGSGDQRAFAVADLTAAYPGRARSLRRGIALLERRRVLVQDEFDPARSGVVLHWRMVTPARIEIAAGGRSAILSQGGRALRAELLDTSGGRFRIESARPPTAAENQNLGYSILTADLPPSVDGEPVRRVVLLTPLDSGSPALPVPEVEPLDRWAIEEALRRADDYQLSHADPKTPDRGWIRATWLAGVSAAYAATRDPAYRQQALGWSQRQDWQPGDGKSGANNLGCVQTYLELYRDAADVRMIAPTRAWLDSGAANTPTGQAVWYREKGVRYVDSIFMAGPTLAMLASATGQRKYADWLDTFFWDVARELYDPQAHLFYRDNRFLQARDSNGKRIFWSRGNGWAFAGLARILSSLPANERRAGDYLRIYREMAAALASCQGADGLFRVNLADPDQYPEPETSGTGLIAYGFAAGVQRGLLDRAKYFPVARKAWNGMLGCLSDDGKVQWGQPVGSFPVAVSREQSDEFVTGAFLLAGSAMLGTAQ